MTVTMKDIAQKTGVSIGTVDRALNNRGRINPEVAQRIKQTAKEMNYRTNRVAKSLSQRNKNLTIAIVLHIPHNNIYFQEIETGILKAADAIKDFGIKIAIYRSKDFNPTDQLQQIDLALHNGANAIILVPIDSILIQNRINQLQKEGIPVVFLNGFLEKTKVFASVHCDYRRSGQLAAGLLRILSREPGNVVVFSNSFSMLGHRYRVQAFQNQLSQSCPELPITKIIELPLDESETKELVNKTLCTESYKYVLYSGNPTVGVQALREFGKHQAAIMYDLSPASRDALLDGVIDGVIFQNPREQGFRAVNILFEYLTSNTIPSQDSQLIDCNIILRETICPIDCNTQ